jgi:hypothetical protein
MRESVLQRWLAPDGVTVMEPHSHTVDIEAGMIDQLVLMGFT